jgi:hypothetical protein
VIEENPFDAVIASPKSTQDAFDVLIATQHSITDSGNTVRAILAATIRPRERHRLSCRSSTRCLRCLNPFRQQV